MKVHVSLALLLTLIWVHASSQSIQRGSATNTPQDSGQGVVVESVGKDSEAQRAGLQEDDIILSWARGDKEGKVELPFDLLDVEMEQAPRGAVTLKGLRNSERLTWTLGETDWKITARPHLPDAIAAPYREGQELLKSGKRVEAAGHWLAGAIGERAQHSSVIAIWLLSLTADMWSQANQWEAADRSYQEALNVATDAEPAIRIQLLHAWGLAAQQQGNWAKAADHYRKELVETQKRGIETLAEARAFADLGPTAKHDGHVQMAENLYRQALALRQRLAPGSLAVATTLNSLGGSALDRGDMDAAEQYWQQALAIKGKVVPDSLSFAITLNKLGEVSRLRGDLDGAEKFYRKALAIQQRLDSGGMQVAMSLNNLGIVESLRGNLSQGADLFRQVLAMKQKLVPNSPSLAGTLENLGSNAYARGLFDMAEEYHREALMIYERTLPNSIEIASELYGLALIAHDRGDLERAWKYYQDALAIQVKLAPFTMDAGHILQAVGELASEQKKYQASTLYTLRALAICAKSAPQSVEMSEVLGNLGALAQEQGFRKNAQGYFSRALAVAEKVAPHSVAASSALHGLGSLALARGDLSGAESYYRRALVIEDKLAPGTLSRADSLHALAMIMRKEQRSGEALELFEESVSALEEQVRHLGGAEDIHSAYRASYRAYYEDYIDLLMSQKQYDVAFQVAERWRARSLLNLLSEAHVDIDKGVDAELINGERSLRDKLTVKSNQLIQLLSEEHTDQEAAALHKEISDLVSKSKEIEGLIRSSSPEYAALTQPQPLTVEQTKQLLDADTVLLEYLVGEEHSYLWLITPDAVNAYPLPKRAEINSLVRQLYGLLSTNNAPERKREQALRGVSEMLLGPLTDQLGTKRLLIVADGALHYLPFGILLGPGSGELQPVLKGARRALVLDHEIVSLPSATTLAVLRREMEKGPPAPKAVAVFADPVFRIDDPRVRAARETLERNQSLSHADDPSTSSRDLERSARESGILVLDRLLSTRKEADEILAFTHEGEALRALDFDASRTTAMSQELRMFRIVHIASHALLNVQHPELSGIVLSLVDRQGQPQDGFLRLQDIYNLKLRADLVVLSACRTALGKEVPGEGLLGLTRGFMYAGAPRVVASLWKVPDKATAELMTEFYRGMLVEGLRPAAALRAAQVAISKQKMWVDPYYWSAFVLQGEWQ